jgi:hypothetical protein
MEFFKRPTTYLLISALALCVYCVILTALTGDIGFDGDDWWVLSWGYWHSFPGSILSYAREFFRPGEGVYWMTMFEIFGFNRGGYQVCSLLLLAVSVLIMGVCLGTAFPSRRILVVLSVWFAFFLPTVSCLTYIVFTDNSRLSMLLFWISVYAFQRWASGSQTWSGLLAPIGIYLLAFVTYESPGFLIFSTPLLVWPVHIRNASRLSQRPFLMRLGSGLFVAFALAIFIRLTLLDGGAVDSVGIVPQTGLLLGYPILLLMYLVAPFTSLTGNVGSMLVGIGVAAFISAQLYSLSGHRPKPGTHGLSPDNTSWTTDEYLPILVGIAVLVLGMLPYQIAGYGTGPETLVQAFLTKWQTGSPEPIPWFNYHEASRIFSAGSFGLAILLAAILGEAKRFRIQAGIAAATLIGMMATFHADLRVDWKEASAVRNSLVGSLVKQVPSVEAGTNFLFLDLESYYKRAAVIRGWSGLRELVRLLYDDPSLGAWYLHRSATAWPNTSQQQAFALPQGLVSRGMSMRDPAPHESLVILKRVGHRLVLVDEICPRDDNLTTGIAWKGCDALASNRDRISRSTNTRLSLARASEKSWRTSLAQALKLPAVRVASKPIQRDGTR